MPAGRSTGEVGYAYRHRVKRSEPLEVPCAGSIAVTLDGAGGYSVSPARYAWHDRFIATLGAAMSPLLDLIHPLRMHRHRHLPDYAPEK